ncbi:MAG: hypothetical protein AAFW46_10160 [Pseudomonadota bacterium]
MFRAVHTSKGGEARAAAIALIALLLARLALEPLAMAAAAGPDGRWPICSGGRLVYLSDSGVRAESDAGGALLETIDPTKPSDCPLVALAQLGPAPSGPALDAAPRARARPLDPVAQPSPTAAFRSTWPRAPPQHA